MFPSAQLDRSQRSSSAPVPRPRAQASLRIGPVDDPAEHEADRIAERLLADRSAGLLQRACSCGGTPGPDGECAECRAERVVLQRQAAAQAPPVAPPIVHDALGSAGRQLDSATRSFFERRLGADLSTVRIHTGAEAARSADAVGARAYTVGSHVVFGAGEHRPGTPAGNRLLAHELVHVLQQRSHGPAVQRDDKEPAKAVDVALVLDGDEESTRAAQALAPKVIRVYDPDSMRTALTGVGAPINTLFIVSHSNADGDLRFESSSGTISWKKLSELTSKLRGALPADKAPQVIDFRGCKAGEAKEALGRFREAVGAKAARATNCWTFDSVVGPIYLNETAITTESQVTETNKAQFEKGLRQLLDSLKAANGTSVKDCTLGLASGQTAYKNLDKIKRQYFAGKGSITAEWVSPEYNQNWQSGSRCFKDLTETTSPCKLTTAMLESGPGADERRREVAAEPAGTEAAEQVAAAEPETAAEEVA